jgi:RNA polymerase sigma-70 factor (ECF subfamily)
VYVVFNEGYAATAGDALIRCELCAEAIRLGRLLYALLPAYPELGALLALTLLHDSRRNARMSPDGEIILLEEQDRALWDHIQIREGIALAEQALRATGPTEYTVQAVIAALHARAARPDETDWRQIADLYDVLLHLSPSPVIELNRAVAIAMADSLEHGLRLTDGLKERGELRSYHLLPAARADLLRRMGRWTEAVEEYQQALRLVTNDAERRFLIRRLAEIEGNNNTHAPAAQI